MLKTRLAGVVAVAVLLSAGVANAAQSTFPSSPNESQSFSFPYEGMRDVRSSATNVPYPVSVSEAAAHSVPFRGAQRSTMAERLSRTFGMYPSSVNESGRM